MPIYSEKCQLLLTLGEPESIFGDPWPDYIQAYGFTDQDVPDLITLVGDPAFDAMPEDCIEVWAPLHAWRVLGQLRSEAAIGPLVQQFPRLCEHEAALSDLPRVFAWFGPAALPALAERWRQPALDQFVRVMALDALLGIAQQHPESREQVIEVFQDYLADPEPRRLLNGLLVSAMLDLQAVEFIEPIRDMYNRDIVDISCAGDLEDVEIELGLRDERSTPKPNYAHVDDGMFDDTEMDDADPDDYLDVLDIYLLQYSNDDSLLNVSALDGLFAALACAPGAIAFSSWMQSIWGGELGMPKWESEEDAKIFHSALMQHYNEVMQAFNVDAYGPLFLERHDELSNLLVVDEWCLGFARGLNLWGPALPADMEKLIAWTEPVRLFITTEGEEVLQGMTEDEIMREQQKLIDNVRRIREHFFRPQVQAIIPSPVVTEIKTGRNDPCPCGSGRKYKKCCLQ